MASNIDVNIPPLGAPTTSGVRANFAAAKSEIESLQGANGFVDYGDAATGVTPISVPSSTWTKLTNDKLGLYTKIDAAPSGVTNLWNAVTNQLALSEIPINSTVSIRADLLVTTTSANQVLSLRTQLGIGSPAPFSVDRTDIQYKSIGARNVMGNFHFYIGSADVQNSPGEILIWSDAACTVRVNGWFIRVMKR